MKTHPSFVAVGDIHGEFLSFCEILRAEHLIDAEERWHAEGVSFLQMGDLIDRGPDSWGVVHLLRRLQREAAEKKSHVVRLVGNHELLLMQNEYYMCNVPEAARLGEELRAEVLSFKIQAAYARDGRLYTHAGLRLLVLEHIRKELGIPIDAVNENYEAIAAHLNLLLVKAVDERDYSHPVFWVDRSRGGEDPAGGIFWSDFRDLAREDMNPLAQVVGHTPVSVHYRSAGHILVKEKGRLINLDAGMYSDYGGHKAWLVGRGRKLAARRLVGGHVETRFIEA